MGAGFLGLNLPTFVAQLISFFVLLGLLMLFGYKPIRKMLDERSNRIKQSMEQTEATKKEYEQAQVMVEQQVSKARQEGQAVIAQAAQMGEKLKEEAGEKAKQEAQAIIDKTRVELERERDRLIDDLRREFVDVAILAAEKVIAETLDEKKHRQLIEKTLEENTTFRKN